MTSKVSSSYGRGQGKEERAKSNDGKLRDSSEKRTWLRDRKKKKKKKKRAKNKASCTPSTATETLRSAAQNSSEQRQRHGGTHKEAAGVAASMFCTRCGRRHHQTAVMAPITSKG